MDQINTSGPNRPKWIEIEFNRKPLYQVHSWKREEKVKEKKSTKKM